MVPSMKVLETGRLVVRWLKADDAEFILRLVNDLSWLRYICDKGVGTLEDARKYIENGPVEMYARVGHGLYLVEITVPTGASASDPPLDLGKLESVAVSGRPIEVGDRAPDFTVNTPKGEELKLADFRGKYVPLDFWASWCAPCVAEMPNLQAIQDQFANDPRFVVVGLNVDDEPGPATQLVKALKLSWRQGFVGPDSSVVSAYGATAIPATFLIGPDGKVLARDLRGEKTKAAVAEVLKP
jgi:peroxiredoxin